jgi:hypothetical protein
MKFVNHLIPLAVIGVMLVVYSFLYSNSIAAHASNPPAAITNNSLNGSVGMELIPHTNVSLASSETK